MRKDIAVSFIGGAELTQVYPDEFLPGEKGQFLQAFIGEKDLGFRIDDQEGKRNLFKHGLKNELHCSPKIPRRLPYFQREPRRRRHLKGRG
jgi:hypothetical protein